jgi:hypothetical protein
LQRSTLCAPSGGLFPLRGVRAGGRLICRAWVLARLLHSAVRVPIRSRSTRFEGIVSMRKSWTP